MTSLTDLRSLLDACPAALVHWDQHKRQAWANKAARALAPLLDAEAWLMWLADVQAKLDTVQHAGEDAPTCFELNLPASAQRVQVRANPAPVPPGGWVLGLTPLTESSSPQAEVTRLQLESQLALAVDLGRIALWRHDFASQRMHYNAQAWSVLGLPPRPEGLSLEEVRAFIHPDDLPDVMLSAQQALQSNQPVDMEARYKRADGSWRHVLTRRVVQHNAEGQAVAFVGVAMDVTESKDAALALRSAAERVALVTRSAGLGTWEWDLKNNQLFWDGQMWLLRGHQPQAHAMTEPQRRQCVHPDDREATAQRHNEAIKDHSDLDYEYRVVWPNGQVRWLASRSKTIFDELGQPLRRIGVNWDITDAQIAAALRQEAEVAQRENTAKSRLMARISHELRTPLNAVLGFTQLLLAQDQEPGVDSAPGGQAAVRRERLGHVQAAGQHLLQLINDVLDLTGLESGEMPVALESVDLAAALRGCLPMVEPALRTRQIELRSQIPPLRVQADAKRLRQVLLNLLSNAVKYNLDKGCIEVLAWAEGPWVRLRVSDTGQGMDEEQLRALFEPFNRLGAANTAIEGSGIGLSIAKTLAERMGGNLQASSQPGQGSSFELRLQAVNGDKDMMIQDGLPLATAQLAAGTQGEREVPVSNAKPARKLLYVEDNPVNALIISELMGLRPHWALHVAADGESGLHYASTELPDLILLDMQLPDMDGMEVLRRLRSVPGTAHIPCFAVSANAMPEDIERALRAGAADYWTKPLDFASFMAALDRLLDNNSAS